MGVSDNVAYGWGLNIAGQLSQNNTIARSSPVVINSGTTYNRLSAGVSSSAAVRADGLAFVWGLGTSGQLGDDLAISRSNAAQLGTTTRTVQRLGNPTVVNETLSWTSVAAGQSFSLATDNLNRAYAWGVNNLFQLGQNTTITATRSSPTQIAGTLSYTFITAGLSHSVATRTDSTIYAWGSSASGQIGDTASINRSSPTLIGNAATLNTLVNIPTQLDNNSWIAASAGASHTVAIRSNFKLYVFYH